MVSDKAIKIEILISILFIFFLTIGCMGATYANFLAVDEGQENTISLGNLAITYCNDVNCNSTYENIGQVIGTKVENGVSTPNYIYPYENDSDALNTIPYIFNIKNTGTLDSLLTIRLLEDTDFTPNDTYLDYKNMSNYSSNIKVGISDCSSGTINRTDVDIYTYSNLDNYEIAHEKTLSYGDDATYCLWIWLDDKTPNDAQDTYFVSNIDVSAIYVPITRYYGENCSFDGELKQGIEYIQGNYKYRYMQEGSYSSWKNISNDGWGVVLLDKTLDNVNESICSSINGKNVISMSSMYYKSNASKIDMKNYNTSNIINMSNMFKDSKVTLVNGLSSFNTSKVTDMNHMFDNTLLTSIDTSSFKISSNTKLDYMFANITYNNLDISSFEWYETISLNNMFDNSSINTIDMSGMNMSSSTENLNVNNVINMFNNIKSLNSIYVLDAANYDLMNLLVKDFKIFKSVSNTVNINIKS